MRDEISIICHIDGQEKTIKFYKKDIERFANQFWKMFSEEIYNFDEIYEFQNIIQSTVTEVLNRE